MIKPPSNARKRSILSIIRAMMASQLTDTIISSHEWLRLCSLFWRRIAPYSPHTPPIAFKQRKTQRSEMYLGHRTRPSCLLCLIFISYNA